MAQSVQSAPQHSQAAFIATLLTGTFAMSISQSSLSTAYPAFMRSFSLSASTVAWLTTGFMLMMSLMIPVSPWLLNNVPFKRLFQAVIVIFALGTALCIWAPNFALLMAGRLLEAIAVGIIFPSYQTVLLTITPRTSRGRTMGIAGLVMGSALAVGPIISGVLLTWFPWRALFTLFLIVSLLVLAAASFTIHDVMPQRLTPLDWLSVGLAASFPALLYVLTEATHSGMSAPLWVILVLAAAAAVWFIYRQLHAAKPLLQLRVFATPLFTKAVLMTGISYIALIVTTIVMPLYFQQVLKVSPLISGLALVPAALLLSVLNPRAGQLLDQIGPRRTIVIGMSLIIVGFLLLGLLVGQMPLPVAIFGAMLTEAGNAFVMMPATTAGANALPNALISDGTAAVTTVRQLLGSSGVAIATLILTQVQLATGSVLTAFTTTFLTFAGMSVIGLLLGLTLPDHR